VRIKAESKGRRLGQGELLLGSLLLLWARLPWSPGHLRSLGHEMHRDSWPRDTCSLLLVLEHLQLLGPETLLGFGPGTLSASWLLDNDWQPFVQNKHVFIFLARALFQSNSGRANPKLL
jgi:hypothetical protein